MDSASSRSNLAASESIHSKSTSDPVSEVIEDRNIDVLIIGGGPAGLSAAYTCQSLGVSHLLVEESSSLGGQLSWIQSEIGGLMTTTLTEVQDVRGQLMDSVTTVGCQMKTGLTLTQFDAHQHTAVLGETTQKTDEESKRKFHVRWKRVIFATGSVDRRLDVPGEDLPQIYGAQSSTSRHAKEFAERHIAVIGGGDRAVEGALHLAEAGIKTTLIHRGQHLRARLSFRQRAHDASNIRMISEANVDYFEPIAAPTQPGPSKVNVHLRHLRGHGLPSVTADAVLVRIGRAPRLGVLPSDIKLENSGVVCTDKYGKTNHDGVYAVGDMATPAYGCSVTTAIGQGAVAARHAAQSLKR